MADEMNKERETAEQWLRDRYGAYRGHFAWRELEEAFLAGRASLAASAGSEPVARVNDDGFIVEIGDLLIAPGTNLYTHPSPSEGAGAVPTRHELALQLLVAGGFVKEEKLTQALALVDAACPALSPAPPASEAKGA